MAASFSYMSSVAWVLSTSVPNWKTQKALSSLSDVGISTHLSCPTSPTPSDCHLTQVWPVRPWQCGPSQLVPCHPFNYTLCQSPLRSLCSNCTRQAHIPPGTSTRPSAWTAVPQMSGSLPLSTPKAWTLWRLLGVSSQVRNRPVPWAKRTWMNKSRELHKVLGHLLSQEGETSSLPLQGCQDTGKDLQSWDITRQQRALRQVLHSCAHFKTTGWNTSTSMMSSSDPDKRIISMSWTLQSSSILCFSSRFCSREDWMVTTSFCHFPTSL